MKFLLSSYCVAVSKGESRNESFHPLLQNLVFEPSPGSEQNSQQIHSLLSRICIFGPLNVCTIVIWHMAT